MGATIMEPNCWLTEMRLVLLAALLFASLALGQANEQQEQHQPMVQKLDAPAIIDPRREKLVLRCDYDLHGKELYSVNWYKYEKTLFRYMPSMTPASTIFTEDPDVQISTEYSDGRQLVILGSDDARKNARAYEGMYACEVSTEHTFHADFAMANVSVAILPKDDPILEGVAHNYDVGDVLEANCTSAPSFPSTELTFYLNNNKIPALYVRRDPSLHPLGEILMTVSRISVSLLLERKHFAAGSLRLSCRARLSRIPTAPEHWTESVANQAASNQPLEAPRLSTAMCVAGNQAIVAVMILFVLANSGFKLS